MNSHRISYTRHPFEQNNPLAFIKIDVDHSYQQHAHDFYELMYISEGKGILFIERQSLHVSEGDLFFIPPGTPHMLQRQDQDATSAPLQMLNCLLLPEVLAPQCQEGQPAWDLEFEQIASFFRQSTSWLGYREQQHEFARIMYGMHVNQQHMPPGYRHKQYILLLDLLHTLYVQHQFSYPAVQAKVDHPAEFAISYIETHYRDPLRLDALCSWIGVSPRHLQRLIKQATGQTFVQLLQNVRVLHSCELLLETDWSVQMVAAEVGIQDMKYFYRIFKQHCGLTPSRFRTERTSREKHTAVTQDASMRDD
ncbi:helix-turn-helix domain-containing protein [Paenibacillus sp. WLX1005]|uniref:helix-turn-helix domain-containing protein n=1 Tax=Paenibacillus sp. WLX1005 TaxID=3243766 RepID=UPI0039841AF7